MAMNHDLFAAARPARVSLAGALAALVSILTPGAAFANRAVGLTTANQLVTFETSTPLSAIATVAITGLEPGEIALAIDFRPATGQLYLPGATNRLYVVNPATGVATAIGAPFTPALSGNSFGFDFNPSVDRIRVVSDTGQNLRLHPDLGTVVAVDTAINPAGRIVGSAYQNNHAGAATTVLYGID